LRYAVHVQACNVVSLLTCYFVFCNIFFCTCHSYCDVTAHVYCLF